MLILRERSTKRKVRLGSANCLGGTVGRAPARKAGDPGSIPGPGENFSLKVILVLNINKYLNIQRGRQLE